MAEEDIGRRSLQLAPTDLVILQTVVTSHL